MLAKRQQSKAEMFGPLQKDKAELMPLDIPAPPNQEAEILKS